MLQRKYAPRLATETQDRGAPSAALRLKPSRRDESWNRQFDGAHAAPKCIRETCISRIELPAVSQDNLEQGPSAARQQLVVLAPKFRDRAVYKSPHTPAGLKRVGAWPLSPDRG